MTSRPLNSDPLRNFRYQVTIAPPTQSTGASPVPASIAQMGFMALSGLSVNNEVIPYREGGNNTTTRKMPGQSEFGPLTLTRGFMAAPVNGGASGTNELSLWLKMIFSVNVGGGTGGPGANFRSGVTIDVYDHPITRSGSATVPGDAAGAPTPSNPPIKARFMVYNAWPMGYSFSDLEAGGNAVFIESLTLAHEGWAVGTAPQAPGVYLPGSFQPS